MVFKTLFLLSIILVCFGISAPAEIQSATVAGIVKSFDATTVDCLVEKTMIRVQRSQVVTKELKNGAAVIISLTAQDISKLLGIKAAVTTPTSGKAPSKATRGL